MNAVRINGGVAGNVVPDLCAVEVNYRFAPDRSEEEALAHMREVFDGFEIEVSDSAIVANRPNVNARMAGARRALERNRNRPNRGGNTFSIDAITHHP